MVATSRSVIVALVLLGTVVLSPTAHAHAVSVQVSQDGHRLQAGDTTLTRVGHGIRSAIWIDIYGCSLYLPHPVTSVAKVEADDLPVAASVRVLVHDTSGRIPGRWRRLLHREVSAEDYAELEQAYHALAYGDRVIFLFQPSDGTRVLRNGATIIHVAGKSLMNAVLEQWIGDHPVSTDLRAALTRGLAAR